MDCIFCKIVNGEIPSYTIFEDDIVKVFLDVNPDSNGHLLIIPKKHFLGLKEIDNKSRMLTSALKNSIQLMRSNKEELMMQLEPTKAAAASEPQMPEEPEQLEPQPQGQESFEVPEDAFLKNAEE